MKVLIAYPFKNEIRNQQQLIYLPELVQNEAELRAAIREHSPQVIIVGNNSVSDETLQLWRFIMGNSIKLTIIRRGTSLSRIDLIKSKELNINVLNTPSVNSRFVAEYMIEHLHLLNNGINSIIGIIGSGAIGSRIADRLEKAKHIVNIYSPSLTISDKNLQERIRRKKGIASPNINISMTPEEAILNATHIIIAIDAEKVTKEDEKLSKEFFKLIPNGSRIVSVTEFRVFGEGALDIIVERIEKGEITARLDSHAFDLHTIKSHPDGLEPVSAAMKGPGCGEAMDQAALVVLADVALEQTLKSPLTFSINSSEKPEEITIIGAGITGLVTGFILSESGYDVIIIDEHDRPQQTNEFNQIETSCRGTTLDGCDARHASITETLPHAQFFRKDSLKKFPLDNGGWRIIADQFNEKEKVWIERFIELAGHPELILNLFHKFVSNLNRRGIELWEDIFKSYPQISRNIIRNRRIIRVCSSENLLNVVSTFQNKYHKIEDNIQKLTHSQVLQIIPSLKLNDGDAGGIEVPGFTVNHIQLCANIIQFLENKKNVKFKWSTQIRSIENISSSKIIFASSLNQLDYPLLDQVSLAVQGVLGCWTKLLNTHSIKNGFKITENEPIGVINVTPSYDEQHLFITGGFAFSGHRKITRSSHLDQLIELFNSKISSYLPEEFEASESENRPTKFCIRPMTPDGLPIITEITDDNKKQQIYFIGGTSAGGFVQSTVLATLITDLFKGTISDTNLCHIYRVLRLDRNTLLFHL